ncbi:MAG: hypothetical protein QGH45_12980 [Myxococcota bacterium]|nr:hypothetical protein [Myxococcota bacterium]
MSQAGSSQSNYDNLMPAGIIVVYGLIENAAGGSPNQSHLNQWANQHGMTHPVLADGNNQLHGHMDTNGYIPTIWSSRSGWPRWSFNARSPIPRASWRH